MENDRVSRRNMLKRSGVILISLATGCIECLPRTVFAGKAAKSDFHYQDRPNDDGNRCADCTQYVPAQAGQDMPGACRIIEGPISPNGWCMAFSKKS